MFKLESYITPLLMGYIDKYVKLNKEDFQLSLWGGDVVLNKVDLRLDVIEETISLPISFKSGFIHELRIHVPWTRIYSEPVVITINTIECILKLRGSSSDDLETASSKSDSSATKKPTVPPARPAKIDEVDLPPGYLQSLINKIINNINIVINNLILKFVEDDIVLSLNVKSAECYSVNNEWTRAFVDLALPDLMLRRILDFHDLTVCLDKRNADGKIESYQDPVFYRCALMTRILMHYDSLNSKLPQLVKLNVLCEKLDMSLTNVQLPMFYRLLDLCMALYYGTIEIPEEMTKAPHVAPSPETLVAETSEDPQQPEEGWISWAWSYVPSVLPADGTLDGSDGAGGGKLLKKSDAAVFAVGVYVTEASILLKMYELVQSSSVFTTVKLIAKPFLLWQFTGICMEMKMRGEDFTDVQFGIRDSSLSVVNKINHRTEIESSKAKGDAFFRCNRDPSKEFNLTYISGSLFDAESPENNGQVATFVFDELEYLEVYNESTALERFGIFWMSYLFTSTEKKVQTLLRFLIGPSHLSVSSVPVERVTKVVNILLNMEHEAYYKPKLSISETELKSPSEEDLGRFSDTTAAVIYRITIQHPFVTIHQAESGKPGGDGGTSRRESRKAKEAEYVLSTALHPAVVVQAEQILMEISIPSCVRLILESGLKPPSDVVDECYSQLSVEVKKLKVCMTRIVGNSSLSVPLSPFKPVLQPCDLQFSKRTLLFPELWRNPLQSHREIYFEIRENTTLTLTKPQLLLLVHFGSCWLRPDGASCPAISVVESLIDDVFIGSNSGDRTAVHQKFPAIEFSITNLDLHFLEAEALHAATATVSAVQIILLGSENGTEFSIPLVTGPLNASDIVSRNLFKSRDGQTLPETLDQLLRLTFQIPKDTAITQAPAVLFLDCRSLVGCFDPRLHDWLAYAPSQKDPFSVNEDLGISLNHNIANATLPLIQSSTRGSESDRSINESAESRASFRGSQVQTPSSRGISRTSVDRRISSVEPAKLEDSGLSQAAESWGTFFSNIFPFVKILELQISIDNWCLLLRARPMNILEPFETGDIVAMLTHLFDRRVLSDTIVVCCPSVYVNSAGRQKSDPCPEIPIKSLQHSIASEKLPWMISLRNCSVYTVLRSQAVWNLLKPMSVGATFVALPKYQMLPLENMSQLGLCIHTDLDTIIVRCSNQQFLLINDILGDIFSSTSDLASSLNMALNQFSSPQTVDDKYAPNPPQDIRLMSLKSNNETSVFDSTVLTSESEITRTFSEGTSTDVRFEELGSTKLTFWLQITLTKLSVQLFAQDSSLNEICVKSDLEDITAAMDVQDVYSKVKCKVGGICIGHYRKESDKWVIGDHEGVLVFCTHQFKMHGPVLYHRNWKPHEFFSSDSTNSGENKTTGRRSHGFLDVVYTRALTENAARRLGETFHAWTNSEKPPKRVYNVGVAHLEEICVTLQPLSVIFHGPVIATVLSVFAVSAAERSTSRQSCVSEDQTHSLPDADDIILPVLHSRNVPLVNFDVHEFSLFCPNLCSASESVDDVCVLHVGSLKVNSQPENPLPRVVIERDIYRTALHSGVTSCPGSEVEDRQYQLDILGLEICSGSWADLVNYGKFLRKFTHSSAIQNPAFEWNTVTMSGVGDEVRVFPLVAGSDLRVVFAPAMISGSANEFLQVVCGYSLEINATSDLDFYLTIDQIRLLYQIIGSNVSATWKTDGNLASDTSSAPSRSSGASPFEDLQNCTQFDILLTGGKVSVILYHHELKTEGSDAAQQERVSNGTPNAAVLHKVVPFLFGSFSQPHLIVSCQRIELSCYDMTLNGCSHDTSGSTANKVTPVYSDFSVHWLETKPGKPDPNTEILSSFCTISLINYMTASAKLEISLGRPLKLLADSNKIKQLLEFITMINAALWESPSLGNDATPSTSAGTMNANDQISESLEALGSSWLQTIRFATVQLVVVMEFDVVDKQTTVDNASSSILFALSNLRANISSSSAGPDQLQSLAVELDLRDVILKTGLCGSLTHLLGPLSLSLSLAVVSMKSLRFPSWYRFIAFLNCSNIQVRLCRDNFLALERTNQHVQELLKNLARVDLSESGGHCPSHKDAKSIASSISVDGQNKSTFGNAETFDDLKAEFFNYLNVDKSNAVPNPGEILFFSDIDMGQATMTWRYFEPRVLTVVKAMQVPFSIQRHHSAAAFDETLKVPCTLQFSLSLGETFEDYSEFFLSQNQSSEADLPNLTAAALSSVVAAEIWRVVIHMPQSDEHISEEVELLVSPLTLAASLRVDSIFVPDLLPVVYLTSRIDCVEVRLFNQSSHLSTVESGSLSPFRVPSDQPKREVCVFGLDSFALTSSYCTSRHDRLHLKMDTKALCHVLEYRNLTLLPLVEKFGIRTEVTYKSSDTLPKLKVDVELDKMFFRLSQSVVQTIGDVALSWQQLHSATPLLLSSYIICNNTNEDLHFGQAETDEDISLPSLEGCPYSWRCCRVKQQLLRIALKGHPLTSSTSDIDINRSEVICASVASLSGQPTTLIVKISPLNPALKQVTISGLVFFANQIDRPLAVKIQNKNSTKETNLVVNPGRTSPSCVNDLGELRCFKLSAVTSGATGWSQEISFADALNGALFKVPLTSSSENVFVWCHILTQSHAAFTEAMVTFCPLYVVRSRFPTQLLMNLTSLKFKTSTQLVLEGHGVDKQLEVDRRDHIYHVTFQISANAQASSPPLTLSTDTIEQVDRVVLADLPDLKFCIEDMLSLWRNGEQKELWPYNGVNDSSLLSLTQSAYQNDPLFMQQQNSPSSSLGTVDVPEFNAEQSNIELQVNLSQFWPGFNTLLIDVSPRWLIVNELGLEIVLAEANNEPFRLSPGRTVAPPVFKESFKVGIVLSSKVHLSTAIRLSDTEQSAGYGYSDTGVLHLTSHIPVCVPVYHDGLLIQHCFLTVHSTVKHNIQVMTVRERFHFVNRSPYDLHLYVTTVESAKDQKVFVPDDPIATLTVSKRNEASDLTDSSHSLLLWNVLQAGSSANPDAEYLPHVRFRLRDSKSDRDAVTHDRPPWSFPVQLSVSPTSVRHSVSLPCFDGAYLTTRTCVLSAVLDSEIVYLVLDEDFYPSIELVNNCNIALYYGQAFSNKGHEDVTTTEETGVIRNISCVQPRSSCHYTPPLVNSLFPEIHDKLNSVRLNLGAMNGDDKLIWSQALEVFTDQSIFVVISKVLDLKVDIKRCGNTVRIHLNPVSRAEVSAKEIRSRIKGKSVLQVEEVGKPQRRKSLSRLASSDSTAEQKDAPEISDARQNSFSGDFRREEAPTKSTHLELSLFCKEASILLSEELPVLSIMCATFDEIGIVFHPKLDFTQPLNCDNQNLLIGIRDLQIDNPSFATGSYDFPVLLKRLATSDSPLGKPSASTTSDKIALLRENAMVTISAEIYHDRALNTTSIQTIQIIIDPLMLFVEDSYLWDLLKIVDKLTPSSLCFNSELQRRKLARNRLPMSVEQLASSLASPIRFQSLCIEPISIELSIHASLKMYLSSDRAPLNFGAFGRKSVCTNSQQLLRALAMHYAVGAIYRAALVFGSLEILGNPTGFVRSIGSGVADMIWLPYEGLTKGPGPCIVGFGGGMKSVARHLSAGTLTSITNFASSVSRNMERLSLDSEHIQRNEITRRRRPSGLSEGLINGLSGFGLSILGAIAGIADQPLQTFTRVDQATSTSGRAKGIVSGFGKGLLGMVTKPIGGAAEFVSQTSLGLLQGIGLVEAFQPRYDSTSWPSTAPRTGAARYHEKILCLSSADEILFCVHDCHMTSKKTSCTCTLVLTTSCLFILSEDQCERLCTFPVADIGLRRQETQDGASPCLVLTHGDEESNQPKSGGRLAAFVDDTTRAMTSTFHSTDERKFPETTSVGADSVRVKYEFHVDSKPADVLIAWFVLAKSKHRKNAFSV